MNTKYSATVLVISRQQFLYFLCAVLKVGGAQWEKGDVTSFHAPKCDDTATIKPPRQNF